MSKVSSFRKLRDRPRSELELKITEEREIRVLDGTTELLNINEEALKKAKEELEICLARRNAQLKDTNEQLLSEIVARKRAQENFNKSLSLLRATLESTADGILAIDLVGTITTFNQKFLQMWRIPDRAIASGKSARTIALAIKQLKDPANFLAKVKAYLTKPDAASYDIIEFKDGRVFESYTQPQWLGKNIIGRVCSFRDITERAQVEKALRQSEAQYRRIIETAYEGIWIIDAENKIVFANKRMAQMLGCTLEEIIDTSMFAFIDREDIARAIANIDRSRAGIEEMHDFKFRRQDGTDLWASVSASPIFDERGQYAGSLGILADISQRKQTEAALREKEEFLQLVLDNIPQYICWKDRNSVFLGANRNSARLAGFESPEELVGKTDYDLPWKKEETEFFRECDRRIMESDVPEYHIIEPIRKADGTQAWLDTNKIPLHDASGNVVGILVTIEDITERMLSEEALRKSLATNRALLNAMPDMMLRIRKDSTLIEFKRAKDWEPLLPTSEFLGKKLSEVLPPEVAQQALHYLEVALLTGNVQSFEYQLQIDARICDYEARYVVIEKDEVLCIVREITERKQMQEELERSQALLRATLDATADGILAIDRDGKITTFNQRLVEMWQLPESIMASENIKDVLILALNQLTKPTGFIARFRQVLARADLESYDIPEFKDGRVFELYTRPQRLGQEIVGRVCSFRDITERRRAEEALLRSEERYRRIIETTSEGVWIIDAENKTVFANNRMAQMLGYTIDEIIGTPLLALLDEEDQTRAIANVDCRFGGVGETVDCKLRRKDGSYLWAIAATTAIFDEVGQCAGALVMLTDITERKRSEEALRESEEQLRLSLKAGRMGIWDWNILTGEIKWSENQGSIHGFAPGTFDGNFEAFLKIIHPEDLNYVTIAIDRALKEKTDYDVEYRIVLPDNSVHWKAGKGQVFCDESGRAVRMLGVGMDVTDRKTAEEALRQRERRLRSQNKVLAKLAKSNTLNRGNLNAALRKITEAVARTLETERVSVWLYDRERSLLRCLDLYQLLSDRHSEGFELEAIHYPAYFKALSKQRTIAATDAHTDPRTQEFSESYLLPLGIASMLDVPIWLRGQLVGVICHEHVGSAREWALEEENFAGAIGDLVSLALEACERRQAEEAVWESRQMLQLVIDNIPQYIFWKDINSVYLGCNRNFAQIAGISSPENIVGKTDGDLAWTKEKLEFFQSCHACAMESNTPEYHGIQPLLQADGRQIWFDTNKIPLSDPRGNVVGILGTFEDITDRKQAEATIQYQASHDLLTGLPNRMLFNERLLEALENLQEGDRSLAVMFLDLDRFKIINDTLGHAIGDRLLQSFAQRVVTSLRQNSPEKTEEQIFILSRWGGDEFILLLPQIKAIEDVAAIAQGILNALTEPFQLEGHQLHISSSIGISLSPNDCKDAETLLRNADIALYRAKERGRNNYQFYTAAMNY